MTREEQINYEATCYGYAIAAGCPERIYFSKGFEQGAKWADAHPEIKETEVDDNKKSWIDTSEELPYERQELVIKYPNFEITKEVFVWYSNDTFGITKMICEDNTWRWLSPGNVSIIKPDYWMPIPNLPN